jgi:hypothetical protein
MARQQTTISQRKGMFLKCPHQACKGKIWNYRGVMKVNCICPDCRGVVSIEKDRVTEAEWNAFLKEESS